MSGIVEERERAEQQYDGAMEGAEGKGWRLQ